MEVPGPRMSLLSGPTHRKCLSSLFESVLTKKKKEVVSCLWSLNNEEAGPGTCMLYSLDKQMSDGFQRCSGNVGGSGVTTQGSRRLNSGHTFLNSK